MERLTWKRNLDGFEDVGLRDSVTVGDAVCRLSAYEDTGLEPEEIVAIKNAFMGRELAKITEFEGVPIARMRELAQAEKDGRITVESPNAPLTLEELREMDGEPVWISNLTSEYGGYWLTTVDSGLISFRNRGGYSFFLEEILRCGSKIYRKQQEGVPMARHEAHCLTTNRKIERRNQND